MVKTFSHISRALAYCQARESKNNFRDLECQLDVLGPVQALVELVTTSAFQYSTLGISSIFWISPSQR